MVLYRRNRVPGGTYFFTVTLADRASTRLVSHVGDLRDAMAEVRLRHPFRTLAICVLPEHLHALWRLPQDDHRYSMRWRLIKAGFTRRLLAHGVALPRRGADERGLWARRFWEHTIHDDRDLRHHIDYIHINPVKHGHVARAADWPHSSFHRYVATGRLPIDWACDPAMSPSPQDRPADP